jgi:hypothetical protein
MAAAFFASTSIAPAQSNAPEILPSGTYEYMLSSPDAPVTNGKVTVTRTPAGVTVETKGLVSGSSSFTVPGRGTTYSGWNLYYHSELNALPTWDPVSFLLERRPNEGGAELAGLRFAQGHITAFLNRRGGSRDIALQPETTHAIVIDGLNFAGAFVVPAAIAAWGSAAPVSVIDALAGRATTATCAPVTIERPRDVPEGDAVIRCDPKQGTYWYDPATELPDVIDWPDQRVRIVRVHPRAPRAATPGTPAPAPSAPPSPSA